MELALNSKIIESEKRDKINNAIILLHGYGGDGSDISSIAYTWKRFINNTIFLCPDGHQVCKLNPNGYQWFDLSIDDQDYVIAEVKKAEKILIEYIEQIKKKYDLIYVGTGPILILDALNETLKGKNVIGGDVACLMPTKDNPNQITAMVASAIMFEIICLISVYRNK